jgi:hypothetical protein
MAVYALWVVFHSPHLEIRRVEVIGAERIDAGKVRQLAAIPVGRNIFRANLYRARLGVQSDPHVAEAQVSRALPDAVRILVRERRPVFSVYHAGAFYEADEAGVLDRRTRKRTPKLPLLVLRNVGHYQVGDRLRPEVLNPALACLRLTAGDRMLLTKIKVDGPHELWLNMTVAARPAARPGTGTSGKRLLVRLGRPESLALKLADARNVLAGRPQVVEEARYLDVSCAGRPVYMAQTLTGPASASPRGGAAGPAPSPAPPLTH